MAKATPTTNCNASTQCRFVPNSSTKGDHRGLMTQGKYSQLVYRAIAVLSTPMFL